MSRGASKISGANNIPLGVRSEAGYLAAAASTLGGISLLNPSYHLGDDAPPPPLSENVYEWSQNIVLGSLDPWLNGKFEPQGSLKRTLDNDDDHENNNKKPKLDIVLVQGLKRSAEEEVQVSDGKKAKLEPSLDIDAPNPQTVLFKCPLCPYLFESLVISKEHIALVHLIPHDHQTYYGCYGFRAEMVQVPMNRPIMFVPNFNFVVAPFGPQPINVLYCCPRCKDPFVTLDDVQVHLSVMHKYMDEAPNNIGFIKVVD